MKKVKRTSFCNLICAVLLLATLVMQFQPFWTCEDCKSHKDVTKDVSIGEYFLFPKQHDNLVEDLTDYYKSIYGSNYRDANGKKFKFRANEILPTALPGFLGSVIGIVGCVLLRKRFWVAGVPLLVGVMGIIGFTTCPALLIGKNVQIHLIVAIAVTAAAAISLVVGGIAAIVEKKKNPKQAEAEEAPQA